MHDQSNSYICIFFLDSRRQEGAASTGTDVNVKLLAAIKSLQDQVADLQAKSTQAVAATQQCEVSQKKAPKELLVRILLCKPSNLYRAFYIGNYSQRCKASKRYP